MKNVKIRRDSHHVFATSKGFVPCLCGAHPESHHHIDSHTIIPWNLFLEALQKYHEQGSDYDSV